MSARIVIIQDDPEFLASLMSALRTGGNEVTVFDCPMHAWDALRQPPEIDVLITGIQFSDGGPHGIAVARLATAHHPGLQVFFTGPPEMEEYIDGLGTLLPLPVSPAEITDAVERAVDRERCST